MANISDFLTTERQIVATIKSPKGNPIKVYGITPEIADKVIELNQRMAEATEEGDNIVHYGGKELLKYIFPLFTDLKFDLPDEQLDELASNPPFALIQLQNIVRRMLTEINQVWADTWENQLAQTDAMLKQLQAAKRTQESIESMQSMMEDVAKKSEVKPAPTQAPVTPKPKIEPIAKRMNTETIVDPNDERNTVLQNGMTVGEVNDAIWANLIAQKSER